jgi:hypothetical protein
MNPHYTKYYKVDKDKENKNNLSEVLQERQSQ